MKINILLLAVLLGFTQLLDAQSKSLDTPTYEPAANTVKVNFLKGYTTSEQKADDGKKMVVAYEQGLLYNLAITTVFPTLRSDKMDDMVEERFLKLIADQVNYVKDQTKKDFTFEKQPLMGVPGATGFSTSFVVGEYTYAYRVIVLNNTYYMLSASSLTTNKSNPEITGFFNSFALNGTK
jgi:hypothetical protein